MGPRRCHGHRPDDRRGRGRLPERGPRRCQRGAVRERARRRAGVQPGPVAAGERGWRDVRRRRSRRQRRWDGVRAECADRQWHRGCSSRRAARGWSTTYAEAMALAFDDAVELVRQGGGRITKARRILLEDLFNHGGRTTAEQLAERHHDIDTRHGVPVVVALRGGRRGRTRAPRPRPSGVSVGRYADRGSRVRKRAVPSPTSPPTNSTALAERLEQNVRPRALASATSPSRSAAPPAAEIAQGSDPRVTRRSRCWLSLGARALTNCKA